MLRPTIDAPQFRDVLAQLKGIDPDIVKALRKDLRTELKPFAQQIAKAYPSTAPLSGMANEGRLAWPDRVSGTIFVTPGRSKRGGQKLVGIRLRGNPDAGMAMAELAGSKSSGRSARGAAMIRGLRSRYPFRKGGRFGFREFLRNRDEALKGAEKVIDRYVVVLNRRLER